ncbi:MAG: ECF transporter S component [Firmicutes bacterium HGW-Firmicutes-7]|nr:MAG: ECF transporter S component [Firmicutes bacterium HGW-Firmicutes-7]
MNTTHSSLKVRYITRVGILSALAFAFMILEFPIIFFFPEYLKIDFSDAIAIIGGIALGPMAAVFIELIKNLLNLILHSTTGGVGELANFLVGVGLVLPIAMIYRKISNNQGLILGMIVGTITMVIVASLANLFVLLPLWGIPSAERFNMVVSLLVPFNIIKAILVSIFSFIGIKATKGLMKYIKLPKIS